jgi:uncharacterized protein YggT (Ycf19 family)
MSYFVADTVGLIIAALNVITIVLLIYLFLQVVAEGRSALLKALDRIFGPVLAPLRRVLPTWRIDSAALVVAVLLQAIALLLKRWYM